MSMPVRSLQSLIAATLILLAGCAQPAGQGPGDSAAGPILAVHVTAAGVISADGRDVTLDELRQELQRLAAAGGKVRYSRDNPTADPHPNAMKVMQAVVDAGVPIQMVAK